MRGELVASSRLRRVGGVPFHEEPVEFVFTDEPTVGFSEREGVPKAFGGALIRITERSAPVFRTSSRFATKVEGVAILEMKVIEIAEKLRLFLACEKRNIKTCRIVLISHVVHGHKQDGRSPG